MFHVKHSPGLARLRHSSIGGMGQSIWLAVVMRLISGIGTLRIACNLSRFFRPAPKSAWI